MPRETTRQPLYLHLLEGGLDFEIREHDGDVRVVLSGSLDRNLLADIISTLTPRLARRDRRIVLDGSRLAHVDFRAVETLVDWGRRLRAFGHTLVLDGWSPYLRAILILGGRSYAPAPPLAGPLMARHRTSLS
ncbi:STAS domain-containing protein [bacterium]|nr:STAS domain-containing protein [bacterium]MBU1074034.1 STAS domain-containing protein [bacterium]MBU1674703.1 STAS domain-containing protein [bacterium]